VSFFIWLFLRWQKLVWSVLSCTLNGKKTFLQQMQSQFLLNANKILCTKTGNELVFLRKRSRQRCLSWLQEKEVAMPARLLGRSATISISVTL